MNVTMSPKEDNCSITNRTGNFSRLALVLQAVILNLTLHHVVEGGDYAGSFLEPRYWEELNYPTRSYYPSRGYYPDHYGYRSNNKYHDGSRYAGYDNGAQHGGWYDKGKGGERSWSQGRQDARRQGQISSGFSNSYSKNEKGDSTVYYHDGLARSADLAYNGLDTRYRDNGGGYERSRYQGRGIDAQGYRDRQTSWYPQYSSDDRASRFYVPLKKTSLYVVPPPRKYYIDKPSS